MRSITKATDNNVTLYDFYDISPLPVPKRNGKSNSNHAGVSRMKLRSPLTLEGAITRCKDILTAGGVATLLNVSDSMIYKMCDADHAGTLRFSDAMTLDVACREKTGETPFADFLQRHIEATPAADQSRQLALGFIEFQAEAGHLSNKYLDLIDNDTHSLRTPSKRDAIEIQRFADEAIRTLEHIKHDVSAVGKVAAA